MTPWVPRVLLALAGIAVIAAIVSISVGEEGPEAIDVEGLDETLVFYAAIPQEEARLGPADAAVEIDVFTDLRATQSADFHREVVRPMITEYVREERARMTLRHRSVGGSEVSLPAVAATAAGEQGRQWQYADLVLQNLGEAGASGVDEEFLAEVADALRGATRDFDTDEWARDFRTPAAEAQPRADNELATELRLPAQPALVVTGPGGAETLVDGPSLAEARTAIERVATRG